MNSTLMANILNTGFMEYQINDEQALNLLIVQTRFRWSGKFQDLIWYK